jgi:hypothetical protein
VEDLYSGKENSTLTPGRNLRLHGQRMRIAGDDPAVIGVWFVSADGGETRVRVDDRDLIDNSSATLTVIIPTLPAGNYFVEIVTQSSAASNVNIKDPRTCRFEAILTVD